MKLLSLLHKVDILFPLNKYRGCLKTVSAVLARWAANFFCLNAVAPGGKSLFAMNAEVNQESKQVQGHVTSHPLTEGCSVAAVMYVVRLSTDTVL